jgi:hypothetical protein
MEPLQRNALGAALHGQHGSRRRPRVEVLIPRRDMHRVARARRRKYAAGWRERRASLRNAVGSRYPRRNRAGDGESNRWGSNLPRRRCSPRSRRSSISLLCCGQLEDVGIASAVAFAAPSPSRFAVHPARGSRLATPFAPGIRYPLRYPVHSVDRESRSGRRDSNPRRPPWQGGTLPLSYSRGGVARIAFGLGSVKRSARSGSSFRAFRGGLRALRLRPACFSPSCPWSRPAYRPPGP